MTRIILSWTIVMVFSMSLCVAQKHSAKTWTLVYEVDSKVKGPGKMTKYRPEVVTNLAIGKNDVEEVKRSYLIIPGSFYAAVPDDQTGSEEWVVVLHAGDITLSSASDKPAHLLTPYDEVFRYKASAKVAVTERRQYHLGENARRAAK